MLTRTLRPKNEEVKTGCPPVKKCVREINPQAFSGVFFGKKFCYEDDYLGCWMCWREFEHKKEDA